MESVDFLASCTYIYSIGRARKKLLLSCSNPRPDSCLGKISRRACAFLDESLAWVLTEVALLRIYNMCMQQPAGFRHFTEVCEADSHVSRRCASHSPQKPSNIRAIYHLSQEARIYQSILFARRKTGKAKNDAMPPKVRMVAPDGKRVSEPSHHGSPLGQKMGEPSAYVPPGKTASHLV